ncbi:MAG: hypothetical protein JXB34_04460 [Bacteroidales bacterium]|nr:hypothetical protein [Bacteroidales bacterium]
MIIAFGAIALIFKFPDFFKFKLYVNIFLILMLSNGIIILFGTFFYPKHNSHWIYWLIEGILDLVIGIAGIFIIYMTNLVKPHILNLFFAQIVALWAVLHGIIHSASARRLKQYVPTGQIAFACGISVILLAFVLLLKPFFSSASDYMFVGGFSIAIGLLLASISIILRKIYSE